MTTSRSAARAADGLTVARVVLAVPLAAATASGRLSLAAWLLTSAWVSDALDGRLARASGAPTRLGTFDLAADTAVGAGLLVGLGLAGTLPVGLALALVGVLGGGFLALRNVALALALQGIAYGWFLLVLWGAEPVTRWVPLTAIALLTVAGSGRLLRVVVPAFIGGLVGLVSLRRGSGVRLPDEP